MLNKLSLKNLIILGILIVALLYLVSLAIPSKTNVANNSTSTDTNSLINNNNTQQTTVTKTQTTSKPSAKVYSGQVTITITKDSFSPKTITIKEGTVVTWINKDSNTHSVVADNGGATSGNLLYNQQYSFRYKTKGIYGYHCNQHSTTTGTIIVN